MHASALITAVRSSLRPMRHRTYVGLWFAGLVSNTGSWMESIAVGVMITQATGQAAWTGLVAALAFAPIAVFGPIAGTLADRLDRRRYLLVVIASHALLASSLAVLAAAGLAAPLPVAAIMLLEGIAGALRLPAWQSILPDVVPEEDVPGAMSLSAAQFNLGRFVGPALAGVVIATGGYALAFGLNAASFGAILVAVALLRLPQRHRPRLPLLRDMLEGFVQSRRDAGIATSVVLISLAGVLAAPFIALVPAVATFVFGGGSEETAVLVTAQALGAIAAALAMTPLIDQLGLARTLGATLTVLPLALLGYALAPTFPLAVACMLLVGGAYQATLSGLVSVVQLRAAAEQRGRALSLFMVALGSAYPLGAVAQGALGDRLGLRATTAATAGLLLGIILLLRWQRPSLMRALDRAVV